MSRTEPQSTPESIDSELSPLVLIDKIVDLFTWIVKTLVKIGVGLIIGLTIIIVIVAIVVLVGLSTGDISPDALTPLALGLSQFTSTSSIFGNIFGQVNTLASKIWDFLKPILQFIIVIVLLRWLLFSNQGRLSKQFQNIVRDIPSVIAVLVVGTLCLITILGMSIPDAISNVALVIVGFYFGQERLRKVLSEDDKNQLDESGTLAKNKDNTT